MLENISYYESERIVSQYSTLNWLHLKIELYSSFQAKVLDPRYCEGLSVTLQLLQLDTLTETRQDQDKTSILIKPALGKMTSKKSWLYSDNNTAPDLLHCDYIAEFSTKESRHANAT